MSVDDTKPSGDAAKAAVEPPKVDKNIKEFRQPPEGIREIYTNLIQITWTMFDIRLRLAQVIPTSMKVEDSAEIKGFAALEKAGVTMAWPEAKLLRNMLTDAVERYEKANGEIKPLKLAE
jgi:hypothetical protein